MRFFLFVFRLNGQIVNIEEQRITGTNDSTRWYGRLKAAFNYAKIQQTSLQWQPVIGLIKNYRALSDWTLSLPLSKRLGFAIDFTFTKKTGLPSEAPSETVSWKNGVTWRF